MNILPTYQSGELTLALQGSLDSKEAMNFQKSVDALIDSYAAEQQEGVKNLILDARELNYISSSGLRIFLTLRRRFRDLHVTGCNEDVFRVFKMTGFTQMMNIEKFLPQVSPDEVEPIPGYPDLYGLTDDTMLKVFPEGTTKETVDRIVRLTKIAFVMEIPTPMTFEIKMQNERISLVYERITPGEVAPAGVASVLRELHRHTVEPNGVIPSMTVRLKEQIQRLTPYLGDLYTAKLKKIVSFLPENDTNLLHGYFTLQKAALCHDEPMILELDTLCYGNPMVDLAILYANLPEDKKGTYFEEFLHAYYEGETEETYARNRQNIVTLSIIIDYLKLLKEGEPSEEEQQNCQHDFQERVVAHWEEILSSLHFKIDFNEEINKMVRMRFYTDSDIDIDWMARKLGTNRHYVSDFFNKVLHTTFSDFINKLRLDYAVELIHAGKIPMAQLPYTVGFNNDHTFRRLFKERFGDTPSQYGSRKEE